MRVSRGFAWLGLALVLALGVVFLAAQPVMAAPTQAPDLAPAQAPEQAPAQADALAEAAEALATALFLTLVAERLVAGLITPVFERYHWDKFALLYVGWAVGGALVWLGGVNFFEPYIADPLTGQILSAVVAGGGGNLLHDLFDRGGNLLEIRSSIGRALPVNVTDDGPADR